MYNIIKERFNSKFDVVDDLFTEDDLYVGNKKVVLFKCHWWDVGRLGREYRIDNYG